MEKRSGDKAAAANGAAAPKKARTTVLRRAPPPKKDPEPQPGHVAAEEEPKTLDVTLASLDALECPLCFAPFEAEIFQCKNGHAACGSCCDRVRGTCPSCGDPIGAIRCRPLEAAIASMLVPCSFASAGCDRRRLRYAERRAHEASSCHHAPCACPLPGCAFSGLQHLLHDHIRDAHHQAAGDDGEGAAAAAVGFVREATVALRRSEAFRVLLHAQDSRVFLLLNGGGVPFGRSLSLLALGPRPAAAGGGTLEYTVVVRAADGGGGALSLSASGPVPCARRWAGHHPTDGFLFVPDAYWSSSGTVSVTVHLGTEAGGRGAGAGGRRQALLDASCTTK
ncbi:unnamed protein product [Urochloa decumbens]|uniref:RING-type E3 ubiquitin transferase n=1 Tax=Urochloa decumbens TaxID=240449 RepID=A0ABC9AGZ3_9POAL